MIIENPYIDTIRQLRVEVDKFPTEDKKTHLINLEKKSRELVQEKIESLIGKTDEYSGHIENIKIEYPSARQQYRIVLQQYQVLKELMENNRALKENLRKELFGDYCKLCKKRTFSCEHIGDTK